MKDKVKAKEKVNWPIALTNPASYGIFSLAFAVVHVGFVPRKIHVEV